MIESRKPPAGLKTAGRRLWVDTLACFELQVHERAVLLEACRTVDLLNVLQASVVADGPVLAWGSGVRANPAAVEARQQRLVLARLIGSLGIPPQSDDGDEK